MDAPSLLVLIDLRLHLGHDRAERALPALRYLAHRPLNVLEVRRALAFRRPPSWWRLTRIVRALLLALTRPRVARRVSARPVDLSLVLEHELTRELLVEICAFRLCGDDARM